MEAALDSQTVLQRITEDGTFDRLRDQALEQLRKHQGLRERAEELVASCHSLESALPQGASKRQFGAIARELEDKMMEEATKAMWEVLSNDRYGVRQEIEAVVHETLCKAFEDAGRKMQDVRNSN